jgi:CubicO group peptidase (beta-lactamase class C family)
MVAQPVGHSPTTTAARFDRDRLDRAFSVLEHQVDRGELPAAVLAVAGPSGAYEVRAFGDDEGRRVSVEDRFRVASVTKPIVATTVLQLVEAGAVTLGEPIQRLLPEFAPGPPAPDRPGGEVVTPWHVLTHTSGVTDADWLQAIEAGWGADELFASVCRRPLAFVPGTEYRYASDSFYLLAELVRRHDGAPTFAAALRRRILDPLGMTATSFHPDDGDGRPVRTRVLSFDDGTTRRWDAWFERIEAPGGGLWSTAADLVRFGRALLNGGSLEGVRILGRPFVELMSREQTAGIFEAGDPPRRPTYGLGWAIGWADGRMPASPGQIGHLGATGSRLWIDPNEGFVVALLANLWEADGRLSEAVVSAVYGALES